MKTKRIIAALLALCLLMGALAGCSSKDAADTPSQSSDKQQSTTTPNVTRQEASTVSSKYAYTATYIDLPDSVDYVNASCVAGDTLYFIANVVSGQETYTDDVTGEAYS